MTLGDPRRHNYELERELAARLWAADPAERPGLYAQVYDEYFSRAIRAKTSAPDPADVARQIRIVLSFLPRDGTYVEIGAGTCDVAAAVAKVASRAYAVEVSGVVVNEALPVEVVITDGVSIPLEPGTADLVYSNQVLEHLHPDDAAVQLTNVRRVLAPGGKYLCITPNRIDGPHDVSRHFSDRRDAFHLKEYTIGGLADALLASGFRRVRVGIFLGGEVLALAPVAVFRGLEGLLERMPPRVRRHRLVRKLLNPGGVIAFS